MNFFLSTLFRVLGVGPGGITSGDMGKAHSIEIRFLFA
jgi:hypothetical protein